MMKTPDAPFVTREKMRSGRSSRTLPIVPSERISVMIALQLPMPSWSRVIRNNAHSSRRASDFSKGSLGYRIVRLNRSIHTGDIFGFPSHLLMSMSSLLLVVMVVTGIVIWRKKLAS